MSGEHHLASLHEAAMGPAAVAAATTSQRHHGRLVAAKVQSGRRVTGGGRVSLPVGQRRAAGRPG